MNERTNERTNEQTNKQRNKLYCHAEDFGNARVILSTHKVMGNRKL